MPCHAASRAWLVDPHHYELFPESKKNAKRTVTSVKMADSRHNADAQPWGRKHRTYDMRAKPLLVFA